MFYPFRFSDCIGKRRSLLFLFVFLTLFLSFSVFTDIRIWKQDNLTVLLEVEEWKGAAANLIEMGMWPKIWDNNCSNSYESPHAHLYTTEKNFMGQLKPCWAWVNRTNWRGISEMFHLKHQHYFFKKAGNSKIYLA